MFRLLDEHLARIYYLQHTLVGKLPFLLKGNNQVSAVNIANVWGAFLICYLVHQLPMFQSLCELKS
jgi:hypothetical protein